MKSSLYKKIGRRKNKASYAKHLRRLGKRQAHKAARARLRNQEKKRERTEL